MALRKIFCPHCGKQTHIKDDKAFCFCLQCGSKIILQSTPGASDQVQSNITAPAPVKTDETEELEHKLQEVEFYYQLSVEKSEYLSLDSDPIYYLKAQDLLVALSAKYPTDYRIWWQLCKPVDFNAADKTVDLENRFKINELYFNKALDCASIDAKRQLIALSDKYISEKTAAQEQYKQRIEEERQRKLAAEEKRRQEVERQRAEAEQRAQEQLEAEEKLRQEIEHKRFEEEESVRQQTQQLSIPLWAALSAKDYSAIDDSYFKLNTENGQAYIAVLKNVSNVMYLMSFRIDTVKGGIAYKEQTLAVAFNSDGEVSKFDRSPVKLRRASGNEILKIECTAPDTYLISKLPLIKDAKYVRSLIRDAKKPLISTKKLFL